MTKVSVLMPVYNGELFLKEAIDSIMCQTFKDWELIIINDGSTDSTEEIVLRYTDPRIKYYKNDVNLGLIKTLNKGIELCKSEFVARMDADDIALPHRLSKQVDFICNHKDIAMVGSNALLIDNDNNINGKIVNLTSNQSLKINLLFSVPFVHPSIMIRTSVLKELKYDENYKYAEDYDLWCRVANKYDIANHSDFLLKYRWHSSNVSVLNNEKQEAVKNRIIERELKKNLNLTASEEDLYLHRITFEQYDIKRTNSTEVFNEYVKLNSWLKKIIKANSELKSYNKHNLIAYLWSRWIVLCIKQKKYSMIWKQTFVPFNIGIYMKTLKIISILSKKK